MAQLDWNAAKDSLKESVPQTQYRNWFQQVSLIRCDSQSVVLGVPSRFHGEWLKNNYASELYTEIQKQVGTHLQLEFEISAHSPAPAAPAPTPEPIAPTPQPRLEPAGPPKLRVVEGNPAGQAAIAPEAVSVPVPMPTPEPEHTDPLPKLPSFNNPLTKGDFNQMAIKCGQLFATGDELTFNPFIIFSGVGMGKTHLLTEVGRQAQLARPGARVRFVTFETFSAEFVEAIRHNDHSAVMNFKKKYRENTDVLLFDDIQGLSGRIKTQEELLHTFNEITARGGKVAFATTIAPHRLEKFIEPLRSRILSGVVAEVNHPSYAERVTLLEEHAAHYRMEVSDNVLRNLADGGQKDIRELLGSLTRIHLQAKLTNTPLDSRFVAEGSWQAEPRREAVTLEEIISLVEHNLGVNRDDLASKSRKGNINWARQVAIFLARNYTQLSLEEIGKTFGRDHATVVHAFQKVKERMEKSPTRRYEVEFLKAKLQSRTRGSDGV